MKEAIEEILENVDQEEFYKEYLPEIAFSSIGKAPNVVCPFHDDDKPSLSVDIDKGFKCFGCDASGTNIVGFYWKWQQTVEDRKMSFQKAVKDLYKKYVHPIINPIVVTNWNKSLLRNVTIQKKLLDRGIDLGLIKHYELGYDVDDERISVPIHNQHGWITDVRKISLKSKEDLGKYPKNLPYDYLTAKEKHKKGIKTHGFGGRLFPFEAAHENSIILCEGEFDAIILNSWGFNALTAGSVTDWKRHAEIFKDKIIHICFDNDIPGQKAAQELLRVLYPLTQMVKNIILPIKGGDVTDYWREGYKDKDFALLLENSHAENLVISDEDNLGHEDIHLSSLVDISDPENYGKRCHVTARISGEEELQYTLPINYGIYCDQEMGKLCKRCPMSKHGGEYIEEIDLYDNALLAFIKLNDKKMKEDLAEKHGLPSKCTRYKIERNKVVTVQEVLLSPSLERQEGKIVKDNVRAFNLSGVVELNAEYRLEGYITHYPNTQQTAFVILKAIRQDLQMDNFEIPDQEKVKEYKKKFNPKELTPESILEKHDDLMSILAHNVTNIYERNDLHSVVDLNYHSPLEIIFDGMKKNSYMETAIIGDTNTGKNAVVDAISQYYNAGLVLDAGSCTTVGLIGGMVLKKYFSWGSYIQQHRRHLTLDEGSHLSKSIEALRTVREGKADYNKADAKRQTVCKTRLIILANDPSGYISSNPYPIMALSNLFGKEADISRFTNAFFLRSEDTPKDIINRKKPPKIDTDITREDFQFKLANAWALKAENIEFVNGSVEKCYELAKKMSEKYECSIPLVQASVQWKKISGTAAALASNVYHMSDDGKTLIVTWQFMVAAAMLMEKWYDSEACEYNLLAEQEKAKLKIHDTKSVMELVFDKEKAFVSNKSIAHSLQFLISRRELTSKCMEDAFMFCTDYMVAKEITKVLHINNCIERHGMNFRKTKPFTKMLKDLLKKEKDTDRMQEA